MDIYTDKNPCCKLFSDIEKTKLGFAYFSNSKELIFDPKTKSILFNYVPVMTDVFDYENGIVEIKNSGWYYIQYILNIPSTAQITSIFSLYKDDLLLEGSIINISKKDTKNSMCFSAQTIHKLEKNSKLSIKSTLPLNIKNSLNYENIVSLFILKLM